MGKAKIINTDEMIEAENIKKKLDKLKENHKLHNIVADEFAPEPPQGVKFSALKKLASKKPRKSKVPAVDLEKLTVNHYEYKEWLDNLKTLVPATINKYTFDDPVYQAKLTKSKDLVHALQNTLGFAIRDDYLGGIATIIGISAEHLLNRSPKEPKKEETKNASSLHVVQGSSEKE